jgi:hypothetical protein
MPRNGVSQRKMATMKDFVLIYGLFRTVKYNQGNFKKRLTNEKV